MVGQAVGWLVGVVCITDNVGFLCTYFKHCASFYYEQRRDRDTEKLDMTPHCTAEDLFNTRETNQGISIDMITLAQIDENLIQ